MKIKIISVIVLLIILGCSNPTAPYFESYQYPLNLNTMWTYERTVTHSNVQPDTVQLWFPMVMKGSAKIQTAGIDTIDTDIEVIVLKASSVDSMNPQFTDSATFLFRNEEDGLYEYGNSGGNLAVPISRPPTEDEIRQRLLQNIKVKNSSTTSTNSEIKQSLKYPIALNSSWMFIDTTNFIFSINKKIIRYEKLQYAFGIKTCFVVEWIYSNPDITVIDYISDIGLMKRTISAKNIHACNLDLSECATFDMTDEYILVGLIRTTG